MASATAIQCPMFKTASNERCKNEANLAKSYSAHRVAADTIRQFNASGGRKLPLLWRDGSVIYSCDECKQYSQNASVPASYESSNPIAGAADLQPGDSLVMVTGADCTFHYINDCYGNIQAFIDILTARKGKRQECTLAALLEARTIPTKASKPAGRASLESTAPQAPAKLHAKAHPSQPHPTALILPRSTFFTRPPLHVRMLPPKPVKKKEPKPEVDLPDPKHFAPAPFTNPFPRPDLSQPPARPAPPSKDLAPQPPPPATTTSIPPGPRARPRPRARPAAKPSPAPRATPAPLAPYPHPRPAPYPAAYAPYPAYGYSGYFPRPYPPPAYVQYPPVPPPAAPHPTKPPVTIVPKFATGAPVAALSAGPILPKRRGKKRKAQAENDAPGKAGDGTTTEVEAATETEVAETHLSPPMKAEKAEEPAPKITTSKKTAPQKADAQKRKR